MHLFKFMLMLILFDFHKDGRIYAMGGYNGRTRMSSVERYDPDLNQWELVASMLRQRSDASAAVLDNKVILFVIISFFIIISRIFEEGNIHTLFKK